MVAILLVAFSSALFTSSSANPGNLVTSGVMEQDNSKDGAAILTAGTCSLVRRHGTVTITNVGDASGSFTLTAENLVDNLHAGAVRGAHWSSPTTTARTTTGPGRRVTAPIGLGTWAAARSTLHVHRHLRRDRGNEYQDAHDARLRLERHAVLTGARRGSSGPAARPHQLAAAAMLIAFGVMALVVVA